MSLKNQGKKNKINKQKLWLLFDEDVHPIHQKLNALECLYNESITVQNEECEKCNSQLIFSEDGFLTCSHPSCGIIYKNILDNRAEWRFYGAEDNQASDPTRCGMPINPLLQESSFGCKVICRGKFSYEMHKIRRYTEWQTMPYREKTLYDDFQFIGTMAQNAGIPKIIIDDAFKYHKKITDSPLGFRGDNRDGILAASLYISCKINNYPRTPKEISAIFYLNPAIATKGCKNALAILNNLEKDHLDGDKTFMFKTTAESFVERYCSELMIKNELTNLCKLITQLIEKHDLMPENTPHSIAGAVIYFISNICQLNIDKKRVLAVSEISEVTINKCFKKLEKLKNELIPSVIMKKYGIL